MRDTYFRGWAKPGPLPPGASSPPDVPATESLDAISGHFRLFQLQGGHRFSTDDVRGKICGYVGDGEFTNDSLQTFGGAGEPAADPLGVCIVGTTLLGDGRHVADRAPDTGCAFIAADSSGGVGFQ